MIRLKDLLQEKLWKANERPEKKVSEEIRKLWKQHDEAFKSISRVATYPTRLDATKQKNIIHRLLMNTAKEAKGIQAVEQPIRTAKKMFKNAENSIARGVWHEAIMSLDRALSWLHNAIDELAQHYMRSQKAKKISS